MFARVCRFKSSSIISVVMGSFRFSSSSKTAASIVGVEVVGVVDDVEAEGREEEEEEEEGKRKGRRGVKGRGAAAGADKSADRAFNCPSVKSCTLS
jgi:hypothetical protein